MSKRHGNAGLSKLQMQHGLLDQAKDEGRISLKKDWPDALTGLAAAGELLCDRKQPVDWVIRDYTDIFALKQ